MNIIHDFQNIDETINCSYAIAKYIHGPFGDPHKFREENKIVIPPGCSHIRELRAFVDGWVKSKEYIIKKL